jgi:hypothetical protein
VCEGGGGTTTTMKGTRDGWLILMDWVVSLSLSAK